MPTPHGTPGARNVPAPGAADSGDSLYPFNGNGGYDVQHYTIAIAYDPATHTLTGTDVITARATQALSRFDLDLHALNAQSVTVDGHVATSAHSGDKLAVTPVRPIPYGTAFTAKIQYGGVPKPYNDKYNGPGGFIAQPDGALAIGQPEVAGAWFPVNDRLTDKASYDITITAPSSLSAISNGVLVNKHVAGQQTSWHWAESSPMASYLAFLAIGKYRVTITAHDGRPVVLAVAATLPRQMDTELAETPSIVDFLTTQFGPYPFNAMGGVVHTDTELDALENQTRPTYSSDDFDSPADAADVMVHELAHQWFGDSVSVGDWSDIWLNEGFATYAEWLWSEHIGRRTTKQKFDHLYQKSDGIPSDPAGTPTQRTLFDDSVYDRGAATLEALRITVGDTMFWKIIRGWAHDRMNGNARTADFVKYADRVSGHSLDSFFHAWLYTSGKPPYPQPMN
ncbi:MAG TPA: M1 family metallopeptidase [Micromonosporaceae bacterium]|nr:M1 family metallopeptidase [Micromonosporaceae bacterium]